MVERRNTRQRQLVLDAVRTRCDHPTADQVFASVRAMDEHVSRATVYRNLHLLADEGKILSVKVPGGERFDLRIDDHAHMVCTNCGCVVDVMLPQQAGAEEAALAQTGYRVTARYTTFEGLCPACQQALGN